MSENTSLTQEQKQAVGLLSIGTFLEYFDLMLYVHMAVLLNDLFFPKYDPDTANLVTAATFCSAFIFRPIGALIFGWIGDNLGRKFTVIITTAMMALSCVVMASLQTYEQIGFIASVIMIICRITQGMSSMGEAIGAELYLTEITKPPMQYPIVALITVFATLGTMFALLIAFFVTNYALNWRIAFWIGSGIALMGSIARRTLRETPEFADAKLRIRNKAKKANIDMTAIENSPIWNEKVDKKTPIALFLIKCAWPACFYFAYIHCGNLLQQSFNYTPEQVIRQNLIISIVEFFGILFLTYLSNKIHPLKILKIKSLIFLAFILICPYLLLNNVKSAFDILLVQSITVLFMLDNVPAIPIFFKHFPVFKRFTYAIFTYALSRALMFVITSFGLVYLIKQFSDWGLLIIMIPINIGFLFGILHFEKLERAEENLVNKIVDTNNFL